MSSGYSSHTNRSSIAMSRSVESKNVSSTPESSDPSVGYRQWIKQLPFYHKWFILLLLTRPFIDMLYFLKEASPLVSPLYWVGVLTPIITVYSIQALRTKDAEIARVFPGLRALLWLTALSLFVGGFNSGNLILYIGLAFKLITPFILGYYISRIIMLPGYKERIIYTLSLASLAASVLMVLEFFVNPSSRSMGNTSMEYIAGFFADPFSYGMYINILLVTGLRSSYSRKYRRLVLIVLIGGSLVLLTIGHLASIGLLFVLSAYKYLSKIGRGGAMPYVIILASGLYFLGGEVEEDRKETEQITHEYAVLSGQKPIEQLAHGRMARWMGYIDSWTEIPLAAQIFGYPYAFENGVEIWISGAVHNEYLRMMFTIGVVGLMVFMFVVMRLLLSRRGEEQYLVEYKSMMLIIIVYSFTALPLLVPMTSYLFAIALGLYIKDDKEGKLQHS